MDSDSMTDPQNIRESQILTPQAIKEIEQSLGDVGRGADFPMSRTRGGSTSSGGSISSIPPPPTRPPPAPPILAQNRRIPRAPDILSGNALPLPRVRPSRSRCASAPGNSRQPPGNLAPIDECRFSHARVPVPPLPNRSPVPVLSSVLPSVVPSTVPSAVSSTVPSAISSTVPSAVPATVPSISPSPPRSAAPSAPRPPQEEWLHDWQREVSQELAKPVVGRTRANRTPSAPARSPAPTYSLFPSARALPLSPPLPRPRFVSSASATPSAGSSFSSPGSGWSPEGFNHPSLLRDLHPDNPYGYPTPPPFRHNWEPPNRRGAHQSINPATAHRAGQTGPPVGSRPRPYHTPVAAAAVPAVATPPFLSGPVTGPAVGPVIASASAAVSTALTTTPTLALARTRTRARIPDPASAAAVRDSTMFSTGRFTYYPVMSPYEAEAALGSGGVGLGIYQRVACAEDQEGSQTELDARMFPLLDHDMMSAEQAATAVAAARTMRNTIFIDRGFDVEGVSRASSYYGDEGEAGLEVVEPAAGVETTEEELGKMKI